MGASPSDDRPPPPHPSEPPGRVVLVEAWSSKLLREPSLVLQARGVPHAIEELSDRSALVVSGEHADAARRELEVYAVEREEEEERVARKIDLPILSGGVSGTASYALAMVAFFVLERGDAIDPHMRLQGMSIAGAVQEGEWWRSFTALTLHGDVFHLAGNVLIGSLFILFCCQSLGTGVGLWAVLLAGFLGNHLEAQFRPPEFSSLGASTAVFGAVGVLCGTRWRLLRLEGEGRMRQIAPIVVGLILLSFLGLSGDRTNILAHCTGLLAGVILGGSLGVVVPKLAPPTPETARSRHLAQGVLAWACGAFVLYVWWLALR